MNCCPRKSVVINSLCDIYDLKNLIVSPTCHKGHNPTFLDIILVSKPRILSDFHNFVGAATEKAYAFIRTSKNYLSKLQAFWWWRLMMWALHLFMSREYLMMYTTHRGLQTPYWMMWLTTIHHVSQNLKNAILFLIWITNFERLYIKEIRQICHHWSPKPSWHIKDYGKIRHLKRYFWL